MFPQWLSILCWTALCFTGDASGIHDLNTHTEYLSMLRSAGPRPVAIKFSTPHCPACVVMKAAFERLSQEFQGQVIFGDVNMLINQESHLNYNIQSIPTFLFFVNGALHNQGTITDEGTLRMWLSSVAALAPRQSSVAALPPQQSPPQQQPKQPQQQPKQPKQPQQQPQQQPRQAHPRTLRVSGACDTLLNDVFVFKGYTASNSPFYSSASGRHLYHDLDCNGQGSSPRWILDDFTGPIASKFVDLDNDKDCRYRARLDWTSDGSLPLGTHRWRTYCGSAWSTNDLHIENAESFATTTTMTTTTTPASSSACADARNAPDYIENVVVIGAGPGGMAAALYAARAGLCPTVLAPPHGGQLLSKGVGVENYPGVLEATGLDMIATMTEQAEKFDARRVNELVVSVNTSRTPFTIKTKDTLFETRTIIVATGADSKWLGVQGEHEFRGHGVSSCAACDGFLFRGKSCAVIGGGETAIEEALMLSRTCSSVTMIHRRDKFRARQVLQMSALKNPNIRVVWNTIVVGFVGTDGVGKRLTHLQLEENGSSSKKTLLSVDAAFVAIGHSPNTGFLRGQVDLDEQGYVIHPSRSSQTSVPGIFAAGDVSDPVYRQAITSAGSGAMAALDAEKHLNELESYGLCTDDLSNFTLPDVVQEGALGSVLVGALGGSLGLGRTTSVF